MGNTSRLVVDLTETLHILTGPTAVGKTELAIRWAIEHDAEIVSCDSLLFYRGMDIGTAKPSRQERDQVPHHCIDLVDPNQQFSIGEFLEVAKQAVDAILGRGKRVLVTGGSGFYLKGFLAPVVDQITIPPEIDLQVEALFFEHGLQGVVDALSRVSPDDYHRIDLHNSRRVIPALKRCLTTGMSITALREQVQHSDFPFRHFATRTVMLQRSMDALQARINARTERMMEVGLVEEVKRLLDLGLEENASACNSIGYREVIAYLKGEIDGVELREQINVNTLKLVKKQHKWFRNQMEFDKVLDLDVLTPCPQGLFDLSPLG